MSKLLPLTTALSVTNKVEERKLEMRTCGGSHLYKVQKQPTKSTHPGRTQDDVIFVGVAVMSGRGL